MKEAAKTVEAVVIAEQNGIKKAHTGALATTDVEVAAKGAETERIKTAEEAAKKTTNKPAAGS